MVDLTSKHFVSLSWSDVPASADPKRPIRKSELATMAVSGFVVAVRGIWLLVVAGHVLEAVKQRLEQRRIVSCQLIDAASGELQNRAIPFDLVGAPKWHVDHQGVDIGLIALTANYVALLANGGTQPLTEESWSAPPSDADFRVMVGIPRQRQEFEARRDGKETLIAVRLELIPLPWQPIGTVPEQLQVDAPRLYGRIPVACGVVDGRQVIVDDIDGMSGGPVFDVVIKDGVLQYWLTGIQSEWLCQSRIAAACCVLPLMQALSRQLRANPSRAKGDQF